jgi:adenosylhomocysteinase
MKKTIPCDIKDVHLSKEGKRRIEWADHDMPVLGMIKERFERKKPLKGLRISACLHITAETANLARTLKAGGAEVALCASNPLSTQDDVTASLVKDWGISTYAMKGESSATYYRHIRAAIEHRPRITLDDGADLVHAINSKHPDVASEIIASMEETTTGVNRLRAMERENKLQFPIIAVNDAKTKFLFDNRYGTGQSTIDGILRATDLLLAGKTFVVAGYGWCGKGLALRARGMGSNVIVIEVDPIRALEATMDGFRVMPMAKAASLGDVFCTVTGNTKVIRKEHFRLMKDGAIVCNSGHFNVEVDIPGLKSISSNVRKGVRRFVDEYTLKAGKKRIYLLAEGRLVNLAAAEGHPASVMDMSFATQALCVEYVAKNGHKLVPRVYDVPETIENKVATLKLKSMNISIERLTPEQVAYMNTSELGT